MNSRWAPGIMILAGLSVALAYAQANKAPKATQQKPDLHGGGAKPSLIPNHEVTAVTLPGFHFTGAQVHVKGACTLAGYKVISDTEIQMKLKGARTIDDREDGCFFTVSNAAGSATSWVVVDLTDAEEQEKASQEEAAGRAKAQAMANAAGKRWQLRFADGATETYTVQPKDGDALPKFKSSSGILATIVVRPDNSVYLVNGGCVRSGQLVNGQVKNGQSMAGCSHPGSWSATVEH